MSRVLDLLLGCMVVGCGKTFVSPRNYFLALFTSRLTKAIWCYFGMILGVLGNLFIIYFWPFFLVIICLSVSGGP